MADEPLIESRPVLQQTATVYHRLEPDGTTSCGHGHRALTLRLSGYPTLHTTEVAAVTIGARRCGLCWRADDD